MIAASSSNIYTVKVFHSFKIYPKCGQDAEEIQLYYHSPYKRVDAQVTAHSVMLNIRTSRTGRTSSSAHRVGCVVVLDCEWSLFLWKQTLLPISASLPCDSEAFRILECFIIRSRDRQKTLHNENNLRNDQ